MDKWRLCIHGQIYLLSRTTVEPAYCAMVQLIACCLLTSLVWYTCIVITYLVIYATVFVERRSDKVTKSHNLCKKWGTRWSRHRWRHGVHLASCAYWYLPEFCSMCAGTVRFWQLAWHSFSNAKSKSVGLKKNKNSSCDSDFSSSSGSCGQFFSHVWIQAWSHGSGLPGAWKSS